MKIRFIPVWMLAGIVLASSGCLRLATAPLRAEATKRGEDAMARLAAISPETIATFVSQRMNQSLGLSPEMQPRIAAINLSYATKSRDVAAGSDRLRSKLSHLRTLEGQKEDEFKTLLTPDQLRIYREQKEKMRERLNERFGETSSP